MTSIQATTKLVPAVGTARGCGLALAVYNPRCSRVLRTWSPARRARTKGSAGD